MFKQKKSLGQNFLHDENILRNIIKYFNIQEGDVVIEIGPGQGALTKYLVDQPISLIAIEIDKQAVEFLKDWFDDKLLLICDDVLNVDLFELSKKYGKNIRIVGNIPYYLTSEILFWLFDTRLVVKDALLMMQLEVARRLVAKPKTKDYGILSVFTQFYTDSQILFKVSRNCFSPKPDVDSAVMSLCFKQKLPYLDEQIFRKIVRATFGKRRKTLWNGLRAMGYQPHHLVALKLDLKKRAEELSVEELVALTKNLNFVEKRDNKS